MPSRRIELVVAADRAARGAGRRFLDRIAPMPRAPRIDDGALRTEIAATHPILERLLVETILAFWFPACVEPAGGFRLETVPGTARFLTAERHRTLTTARLTWFFAALSRTPWGGEEHLEAARHGVTALREMLWDADQGGFFFEVDAKGHPRLDHKDTYTHAFALKALSEVSAAGEPAALDFAGQVLAALDEHMHDDVNGSYREVAGRSWETLTEPPTTRNPIDPGLRTLNCQVHLVDALEAYARASGDADGRARLAEVVPILADTMLDRVHHVGIDPYDPDWTPRPDCTWWRTAVSYGHEAERVTVLDRCADTLGLDRQSVDAWSLAVLRAQMRWGLDRFRGGVFANGALEGPAFDTTKIWWVQAESLHAYLAVFGRTGDRELGRAYLDTLRWIDRHQVDWAGGEWFERVGRFGRIQGEKSGEWKTPYHIGRVLLDCLALTSEVLPR